MPDTVDIAIPVEPSVAAALAAGAETIVIGDEDLLVLHLWRRVRILRPADYLALAAGRLGAGS